MYRWQKKIVQDKEYALILKTKKEKFPKVKKLVRELHSYEIPCITYWKSDQTDRPYLDWIKRETK
jgi:periplasmic divalent cation tolerance protein